MAKDGERVGEISFISEGNALIKTGSGGVHPDRLGVGDAIGLMPMVLDEVRTASIIAETYCEVFLLSRGDFERIKRDYPEFSEILGKTSSEKADRLSELMLEGIIL